MKGAKKYLIALGVGLFISFGNARAQSIAQLIEQLVLDTEKLTELKAILQDMYKSYEIINNGYSDIRNIVQGNFNLHKVFLDGLLAVSPAVQNYSRVKSILNTEYSIVSEYKAGFARFSADGHFTIQELDYMNKLYSTLFTRSLNCVNELVMVLTADQLRMSDAERLQSIDRVYADITGQLRTLREFNNNTSLQAVQRAREAGDIGTLKSIY